MKHIVSQPAHTFTSMCFPHTGHIKLKGLWKTGVPFPVTMSCLGGGAPGFTQIPPKLILNPDLWHISNNLLVVHPYCSGQSENAM